MYKQHFPIFTTHPRLIYLDSAATALKPQVVIDSLNQYYGQYSSNIHRGLYPIAQEATQSYEQARSHVAEFINARPSETIFTKSATEALNLLAFTLQSSFNQGDEILLSQLEHHANLLPWQHLANQTTSQLKFIPLDTDNFTLDFSELLNLVNQRTKIVSLTHASNVTGSINNIKLLVQQIKSLNSQSLIIVDGAQAISHLSVDVQDLGCDFYVFSGHKLFGPTGIGVLWGKQELLNQLPPYQLGGDMVSSVEFNSAQFLPAPARFEAGTPPIAQAIGLGAACNFFTSLDRASAAVHLEELTDYALASLSQIPDLQIIGSHENHNRIGVISFTLKNIHPHDIAQYLGDHNICIRAGHHCAMPLHTLLSLPATARISLQIYNTKADIDKTVSALKKLVKLFNK